jgi:hypothetical protein
VTDKSGLDELAAEPIRTCANGEAVKPIGVVDAAPLVAPPGEQLIELPQPPGRDTGRNTGRDLEHDIGTGFAPER